MSNEIPIHNHESWVRAIESDDSFYLACPNDHGWLPPRRVCNLCGSTTLDQESLPDVGTVETYTKIHISTPKFEHEDPVVVAIIDFGPVRLTGQLRSIEYEDIERGTEVMVDVKRSVSTDGASSLSTRGDCRQNYLPDAIIPRRVQLDERRPMDGILSAS